MTTISIDIGYDSADTFRAKSAIVGKKKNDDIIYYYGDIKNNKRNAKFTLIGEVQYSYLQSGVGNCGKDYGNGNKVKESDAKYSVTIGEASSKKFENFYTASTDTAKLLLTELLEAAYDDGKSFTKLKAAFKKKLGKKKFMSLLHVTGEKDDSLQCTTKVNTKFGTKTVTIGMMSKRGDVIEYSYPYVPAGSVIAFGVKLSIYDNMNQNPDKNDIKIFGAYELTRDFLVLHVDKSIFEKKTVISSKLRNLAMSGNEDGEDDYDDLNNGGRYTTGGPRSIGLLSDDDDDEESD